MSDDAAAPSQPVTARAQVGHVRISIRSYFSTYMLWAARDFASKAAAIEANHKGDSCFDFEHRASVLSAVINAVAFLEAMVNELFQDAADGHNVAGDGYIAPLSPRTLELMREWWLATGRGYERLLEKLQLLLVFAGSAKLEPGAQPFQDAKQLVALRNKLIHYKPESVAADMDHRFAKSLRGRFPDNVLMVGSGNAWWPDHALGAGCAEWAHDTARVTADTVSERLGIEPPYRRHDSLD